MPDQVADYLRTLNTSDRARAAAWDAIYLSKTPEERQQRLAQLPFSNEVKADLWELGNGGTAAGGSTPQPATAEQFIDQPPVPQGSAMGRFVSGAWQNLNPVTAVEGVYHAVRHPLETATNIYQAQAQQFGKAGDAFQRAQQSPTTGGYLTNMLEAAGYTGAGVVPLVGPAAARSGETIAQGDVAGGLGQGAGLLAPFLVKPGIQAARRAMGARGREAVAAGLDAGAADRVAEVMSPTVGPNKTRFGNRAAEIAPRLAKDMAEDGAPFTREGFHAQVGAKLEQAESALDAASDARLSARTFETQPLIDALLEKRRALTAEAVDGSVPARTMTTRTSPIVDAMGKPIEVTTPRTVAVGRNVVPGPNGARVAAIDQAIGELEQLGPVARYEPIRRIRQAYDSQAKAVYNPSMTADYLKAQGGKLGAADVTGVLRDTLAKWEPETATANAQYALYRTANDVLQATKEIERVRPRVGRQIAARIFGTVTGAQTAGAGGAVAGYLGAPLIDAAVSSGFTTRLQTARLMTNLAEAIRSGDLATVNSLTKALERELAAVQAGRQTEAPPNTTPALATP